MSDLNTTGFMSSIESISSTDLHARTRPALRRANEAGTLAVTLYNNVDAFLVSPAHMEELQSAAVSAGRREREIAESLPLILTAVQAGVAIPSETLNRLAPGLDRSWDAVAEFIAALPVRMHGDEDGAPIIRGHLHAFAGPVPESGDDDELDLDA